MAKYKFLVEYDAIDDEFSDFLNQLRDEVDAANGTYDITPTGTGEAELVIDVPSMTDSLVDLVSQFTDGNDVSNYQISEAARARARRRARLMESACRRGSRAYESRDDRRRNYDDDDEAAFFDQLSRRYRRGVRENMNDRRIVRRIR